MRNGEVSFWYADIGGLPARRPALEGDATADVCIIGAGYTGLWAAWYLKRADPSLKILICEAEFAGFGASGRNGGWLTGGFAWNHDRYAADSSPASVRAMIDAMAGTVDQVIGVAEAEGIDADIARVDELTVAVTPAQVARLQEMVAEERRWGQGEDRIRLIGAGEARARVNVAGVLGASVQPGMARVQPAKLVRGLAAAVERLGVKIVEDTRVTGVSAGKVTTDRGVVTAGAVLRATEGFTARLPGHRRDWLPLNSAQIVTAPLSPEIWAKIGWQGNEILGDFGHAYCYAQRTREGRIAMGGRGVPYLWGSAIDDAGRADAETINRLKAILYRHFPMLREVAIDHAWCGVLGVPRDWCATVGFDADTRIGWAGGYVGVGVSTSNLAGRTLADLTLGRKSGLTSLPWVNRKVRKWEPEPLRWLGLRGMYRALNAADRAEARGGPPSRLARAANWLAGR